MPNGGERISIRPMETADIYRLFAHVDSAEGLLDFVEKFGLLWEDAKEFAYIRTRMMVRSWSSGLSAEACRSA
jgi:hypothetical protein